jgi:hypothetical protein
VLVLTSCKTVQVPGHGLYELLQALLRHYEKVHPGFSWWMFCPTGKGHCSVQLPPMREYLCGILPPDTLAATPLKSISAQLPRLGSCGAVGAIQIAHDLLNWECDQTTATPSSLDQQSDKGITVIITS